jgi:hypothetical protein
MNFAESSTYEAVVTLDPNHSADPFSYTFTVFARDIDKNSEVSAPAGEVELAGEPPFDEPPSVSAASVSPTSLPAGGGSIVIRATATDNLGITESFATIDLPGGGTAVVALEPVSFTEFEGTYVVPANNLAGSLRYPVHVTVLDEAGGSDSADPGAVTVAGRGGKASKLKSNHKQLDFGTVRVGRTRQMRVEIKHEGDKRAAPIPLTLRTSGAPFQIFTERLVLAPGKKAVVLVQFAPTAPGRATGSLIIERGDGGPPLEVALRGKGK